ncbi:unnamed protein product [Rotaria sp. Silwood2]|nr:unnamed protein product [Rotaria sp. Silwood2]CAF4464732.1 unnamed protein product [Rotaria sp. Silwood2]CAF4581575.1 unnamed protein product [Rotaria sp. Silwood2]
MVIMELPPFIILKTPTATYSEMTGNYKKINITEFYGFYKDVLLYLQNKMGFIPVITLAKPTTEYNELVEGVANDDIKNGKISSDRIGIVVGCAVEDYYLNSISQRKKDYYPLKTADEIYTTLINGNIDVALWNNLTIEYHTNNIYCDLMPVGVEFSHSSYQLPVKKD